MIDYFKIIHKYIKPDSKLYRLYIVHVTLVTHKALSIARKLDLSKKQMQFIEEASMLHDIGVFEVDAPEIFCFGKKAYHQHILVGYKILKKEGLPKHAEVALRHTGVGITKEDIRKQNLDLPEDDYVPETLEQRIISYSDIFFSKSVNKIWKARSLKEAREVMAYFGKKNAEIFDKWSKLDFSQNVLHVD